MSRIGKKALNIPKGVELTQNGTILVAKKGKNSLELETYGRVTAQIDSDSVTLLRVGEDKQSSAFWGTYRSLLNNIMIGVDTGFSKTLEINGVGYRAAVKGKVLELQLGFSHPVNHDIPDGIDVVVEKNSIKISGMVKQEVGQVAAEIRAYRPPEPYKGKGVKYSDEHIIRKAGKTAGK